MYRNSAVLLRNKSSVNWCKLVQVLEKKIVKPYTVNHILSQMVGTPKYKECMITPIDSEKHLFEHPGLLLANLITKVTKKNKIPMVLVNHTDRTLILKKGQIIGVVGDLNNFGVFSITEYEKDTEINSAEHQTQINANPLKGLKCDHLTPEQREKLENLLMKFENKLFAKSTKELGHTNVVKLSIDTGDANIIKQRPYRTPFSQRPIIETEINDMLDANIIRPSCFPWSSPIVVVGKMMEDIDFVLTLEN